MDSYFYVLSLSFELDGVLGTSLIDSFKMVSMFELINI